MWLVFLLLFALISYGVLEYHLHRRNLELIPYRIHVNGTRGKSSVTRLIGGGLKGAGKRVFIKTTGTKPRTIDVEGNERPIYRVGKPNIIEQLKIVRQAARQKAEFFVVECMAVQPDLQYLTERRMIRSQVGVITNIREDHLDVMGPTIDDVAEAMCNAIPKRAVLFTTERRYLDLIRQRAARLGTKVHYVEPNMVDNGTMRGFSYLEHKSNVALALAVCRHFGVDDRQALQGMYAINPDPGVLRRFCLQLDGKEIDFVNAFAANDPESYLAIWEMLHIHQEPDRKLIVLVNSRSDRIQRAEQLGEFIATKLTADFFVVSGEYTHPLVTKAIRSGLPSDKIKNLGGRSAADVFNFIVSIVPRKATVVGIGNIVGHGEEILNYFVDKGRMVA